MSKELIPAFNPDDSNGNQEPSPTQAELMGYAGSEVCFDYHPVIHNDFITLDFACLSCHQQYDLA